MKKNSNVYSILKQDEHTKKSPCLYLTLTLYIMYTVIFINLKHMNINLNFDELY